MAPKRKVRRRVVLCVLLVIGAVVLTSCNTTHFVAYEKKWSRQGTVNLHTKLVENSTQYAFYTSAAASLCAPFKVFGPWIVGGCALYVGANSARARDVLIMAYKRGQCFRLQLKVPRMPVPGGLPSYWSMASAECTPWDNYRPTRPGGGGSGGGGGGGGSW